MEDGGWRWIEEVGLKPFEWCRKGRQGRHIGGGFTLIGSRVSAFLGLCKGC